MQGNQHCTELIYLGRADILAEAENLAVLQLFNLGRSGGMLPQEILVVLGVLRHTKLVEKRFISWLIIIVIVC